MPVAKLENGSWPHPARLPLGCGWAGHCTAPGHENEIPPQDILEAFCNLGYASGCTWAPLHRASDSIRFGVSAPSSRQERRGATTDISARILHLNYVSEREHRPAERGELEFDLSRSMWVRRHDDPRIQRMAECFLESYLKKQG